MTKIINVLEDQVYLFDCPHCSCQIQVSYDQVNCMIFRHGVYRDTMTPINPHASERDCDSLINMGMVYGCCKPFRLTRNQSGQLDEAIICDYI